ncbi:MAG TPA: GNAT family N-acetyltransferase [Streptosporangiaceae bacterium]|nr:GNAT family N-acetyltransferase [Streptosporangiaceae bacterium]
MSETSGPAAGLVLRPLEAGDEAQFRDGHAAMAADGFVFGLAFDPALDFETYLRALADHRAGRNLPERFVPGTFLVADVAGEIVGRASIRHELNDFLLRQGGHIGYGVLPGHRRRGYATEILRQSVVIAASLGIGRVLVTCDDDNAGSAAVIEANGGRLENVVATGAGHPPKRRYWIG